MSAKQFTTFTIFTKERIDMRFPWSFPSSAPLQAKTGSPIAGVVNLVTARVNSSESWSLPMVNGIPRGGFFVNCSTGVNVIYTPARSKPMNGTQMTSPFVALAARQ